MAHEATHVAQQHTVPAARTTLMRGVTDYLPDVSVGDIIPDWVLDGVRSAVRAIPGYTLLTYITGTDPLTDEPVTVSHEELIETLLTYGPFGAAVGTVLQSIDVLGEIFDFVAESLAAHDLTLARLKRDISSAWDELSVTNGIAGNVAIVERYVTALLRDVGSFVASIVDRVLEIVRSVVAEVAEPLLETPEIAPVWNLAKKVLHYDPLRGVEVQAETVEIIADFMRLIGQEQRLAQMEERGTLQETADWLDTQLGTFASLVTELGTLFSDAWEAIQPQNLPDLFTNLGALAQRAFGFVQRVGEFAATVIVKILELIKDVLLGWLSENAHTVPGFHLLTVILGQNPFTGEQVLRTAENLIKGFITLMPGGEATYEQLAESGVISSAAERIEGEMARLGISLELITGIFLGIWDTLTLDDLLDPIGAFGRILDLFGEPLSRLIEFIGVVIEVVITLVLKLMNFPSDLVGSIIANALQAIEDIKRDPVAFVKNMLAALKLGFTGFLDNILTYLTQGLTAWLFRGLGQLGITIPSDLSLGSILNLVLQVLGVTVEALWTKLGAHLGPERVAMIRGAVDQLSGAWAFIKDVQEGGIGAVWRYLTDQLSGLWDTLLDMAKDWIMTTIIGRVTAKLLTMLDPTGIMAVVNSFIAFFAAVQSAIEYLRDILEIINRYVTTFAQVAAGNIVPGAQTLERGLASAIPVAIGFLANQVGLGNIPEKIVELIGRLREIIDQALDWLIEQALRLGAAALNALGVDAEEEQPAEAEAPAGDEPMNAESIPEGLPPDEIKRLVLDMVSAQLRGGGKSSIAGVHGALDAIAGSNRDSGLVSLRVSVPDQDSMEVLIEASASSPQGLTISWAEIFAPSVLDENEELEEWRESLSRASQASYAAVAVDGRPIGALSSSGEGLHAEEGLVRSDDWGQAIAAAKAGVESAGTSRVTLMINRTPCVSCVEWLKSAIAEAKSELGSDAGRVTFVMAATGTYRRQARLNASDLAILKAGSEQMAQRTGRPFDEVFKKQEELWKQDLRSMSTEWSDSDEMYSGLGDLALKGWVVVGLDAGQTVTARQLQVRTIAAALAGNMGHDS
jgi:hypothetical protein